MNGKRTFSMLGLLSAASLAVVVLAACSGSATPQLIGSYPRNGTPAAFEPPVRAYNTALEIEVADVDAAAQQALQLAVSNGGYLLASQSWYQDGSLRTSVTLVVPGAQFDALRRSIIALGRLVDERLTSQPILWPPYSEQPQAVVAVTFSTAQPQITWPAFPTNGSSPAQAFAQAFAVFTGIFLALIDVVIWVGVVVGPFVLMALGLRWLIRRGRRG